VRVVSLKSGVTKLKIELRRFSFFHFSPIGATNLKHPDEMKMKFWIEYIKGKFEKEIVPGQSVSAWDGIYKNAEYEYDDKPFYAKIQATQQAMGAPYTLHRIRIEVVKHKFTKTFEWQVAKTVRIINPRIPIEVKFGEVFPVIGYSGKGYGIIIPEYKYFSDEGITKEEFSYFIMMFGDSEKEIQEDLETITKIFGGNLILV